MSNPPVMVKQGHVVALIHVDKTEGEPEDRQYMGTENDEISLVHYSLESKTLTIKKDFGKFDIPDST